ncbi:MAG: hypothetical protein BWZ03_00741 [bacterium ADurb.BinA186]|nr:MAG: hypothetical protein BWZ03_00741 [bacterium ADurb.BinA186]
MKSLLYISVIAFSGYFLSGYSSENNTVDSKEEAKPAKEEEKPAGCGLYDFDCALKQMAERNCPLYDFQCEKDKEKAKAELKSKEK